MQEMVLSSLFQRHVFFLLPFFFFFFYYLNSLLFFDCCCCVVHELLVYCKTLLRTNHNRWRRKICGIFPVATDFLLFLLNWTDNRRQIAIEIIRKKIVFNWTTHTSRYLCRCVEQKKKYVFQWYCTEFLYMMKHWILCIE